MAKQRFQATLFGVSVTLGFLLGCPAVLAQKSKPGDLKPPEPGYVFPPGGPAGGTLDVHLGGYDWTPDVQFFALDPCVRIEPTGGPGPVLVPPPPYWFGAKGTLAPPPLPRELPARLTLPKGLPAGPVRWAMAGAGGAGTKTGIFWVGTGPEVVEVSAADREPQKLPALPVTVNGRLSRIGEVDRYRFTAQRDGPVTCEVFARRLGADLNAAVTVRDAGGRVVADAVDTAGQDLAVTFRAAAGAEYTLDLNDLDFRGDRSFVYRLALTPGPRVVATVPAAGRRGESCDVEIVGYGVRAGGAGLESVTRRVAFPADPAADAFAYRLETPWGAAPAFSIPLGDRPEAVANPGTPIVLPAAVTGVLDGASEARFPCVGKKGDVWELAAEARRFGSPLDLALAVLAPDGKELARNDDRPGTTDAGLVFAVPADGTYTLVVSDLSGTAGTRAAVYRLTANRPGRDFTLSTTARLNVPLGGTADLVVTATRTGGHTDPIALAVAGLPEGVTVPAGLVIPAGTSELKIPVRAAATAPASAGLVAITGTAGAVTRPASAPVPGNLAARHPGEERTRAILLATTLAPRLKLVAVEADGGRKVHRGSTHPAEVTVERFGGFQGEVGLQMAAGQSYQRQGITGPDLAVPAGADRAFYPCFMPEWLETSRTSRMELVGVVRVPDPRGTERYLVTPMAGRITMSIEGALLKVDAGGREVQVRPGESVGVPVTVLRSAKLAGPVRLELRLPDELAGRLTAEPVTVAAGQAAAELRITCPAGLRAAGTVVIRGTALRDGKHPVVSEASVTVAEPAGPPPAAATRQVRLNGQTFTLPAGFEVEVAAGPPLTRRPVAAAFDEAGRLFVTEAAGTNDPVKKQLADRPHTLLRLVDADGDGRFEAGGVFADKLMMPQGVMCLGGAVYVGHPPVITKFTDADGDGRADKRETWFDGKTLTGCANDLHGPYPGPDGRVYWTKGAFDRQTYTLPTGKPFATRAAHVFRARPDGTAVESVMTGGMDNPVDVAFTLTGERILTATFVQHPAGGWRDGLVHAVYGGVYGKDHDPIADHPWTGPDLMPVLTHLGAAAPCGLHRYESAAFGPEYTDNLFACAFNMRKVTRHVLVPDGATYRTLDSDFLTSDGLDFHPTDVIEDADGSLLVVDTGGWYKLCCPTSQFVKPDVLGAIYRVRRAGAKPAADPRGLKIGWDMLTPDALGALLGDPRPAVRQRAIEVLGSRPEVGLPVIDRVVRGPASAVARRNALWAAARFGLSPGRHTGTAVARAALADADESVRHVAIHVLGLDRDTAAVGGLLKVIRSYTPHNRRAAAEALGRIGDTAAVPALLAAHKGVTDRVLQHSLTYALIEIADPIGTAAGLADPDPAVRRAAVVALDQMPGGRLRPEAVTAAMSAADPELRRAAWWAAGRHPEWGAAVADVLRDRLRGGAWSDEEQVRLASDLGRLARSEAVQGFLADRMADPAAPAAARRTALLAAAAAGLRQPPAAWYTAAANVLAGGNPDLAPAAVGLVRAMPAPAAPPAGYRDALAAAGRNDRLPPDVRLRALAAVPGGPGTFDAAAFGPLTTLIHRDRPAGVRSAAAEVLAKADLSADQLVTLASVLKTAGPTDLDRLLEAFGRTTDDRVGTALLAALADPPLRAGLRVETLKPRLAKYGPAVQKQAEALYAGLAADGATQAAKLAELLGGLKGGDVRRGQAVFHSPKAACITCHQVGYVGGRVGPDLTKIGGIRTERDLLEAVVFPSASFVRSYEPVTVATLDGRVFQGVLKADAPDEVVLAVNATDEVRLARRDIEAVVPGTVSVMPGGFDQLLTKQELADLIAYLGACR